MLISALSTIKIITGLLVYCLWYPIFLSGLWDVTPFYATLWIKEGVQYTAQLNNYAGGNKEKPRQGKCYSGMLLIDLSKTFHCIVHDLLIGKLNAYGFDYTALALLNSTS